MNLTGGQSERRAEIDQWRIADAGLSPRVVHCAEQAGIHTVGELRTWDDAALLRLRHFGTVSLDDVKRFFRLTRKLEQGDLRQFADMRAIMGQFLNKQEIYVLEQRFALNDPLFRPRMRRRTLQSIADSLGGMTRERVRQVEEEGLGGLRSQLCRAVSQPLLAQWSEQIQSRGGVITSEELTEWRADPRLGGYQPWGLFLLLSEATDCLHLQFDYFATLTPKALGRIEAAAIERLNEQQRLVEFAALRERLRGLIDDPAGQLDRVLRVVLNHHPDICATVNDQYFLTAIGAPRIIETILADTAKPLHFRDLTELYNQRMTPNSRRGSGFVLRMLTMMPRAHRTDRAVYGLAPA